jgi:hydantoinase/carbamoylase family amidase
MTDSVPRVDPERVLADLDALAARTGGPDGARRVAWTPGWVDARAFLRERLAELPVDVAEDEAGNVWAELRGGGGPGAVVVGSHVDAVPRGGWLDGALGVLAAVEVLRAHAAQPAPRRHALRLVDWADEEGARFGSSLLGSRLCAGDVAPADVRDLRDVDGIRLGDALAGCGVDVERAPAARSRLADVAAYLELHIEQGPVLEDAGESVGAVLGTVGLDRVAWTFTGQAAHAGTTPLDRRRDAVACAARLALAVREIALAAGGLGTVGRLVVEPNIPTAVAQRAVASVDLRHGDAAVLARMMDAVAAQARAIAAEERCDVAGPAPLFHAEPAPFAASLVELARAACLEVADEGRTLWSGALHDATVMARHVPTAMVFSSSRRGLSHCPEEDTDRDHLRAAIAVFGLLAGRVLAGAADAES